MPTVRKKPDPPKPLEGPPAAQLVPVQAPATVLDWKGYFDQFCMEHSVDGGSFVVDEGRLLFGDGWSCSADDHTGPYWPPPMELEHLLELQVRYWRRRRGIVKAARDDLAHQLKALDDLRLGYALPLMAKRILVSERGFEYIDPQQPYAPLDWEAIGARLRWLTDDVANCDRRLRALGEEP